MEHLSNYGSVTDIKCYLKNGNYSAEYLTAEIDYERSRRNRTGVILEFERQIKRVNGTLRKRK